MEKSMATGAKVYVSVAALFRDDGTMLPTEITWEDGKNIASTGCLTFGRPRL